MSTYYEREPQLGTFTNIQTCAAPYLGVTGHVVPSSSAVKELRCAQDKRHYIDAVYLMYRDELGPIWSTLDHPFVVPFLGVTEGENSLPALKTAYFENGNVITYNNKNVTHEADKLRQVMQLTEGVDYLHGQGLFHGNLTATNVLIKRDGSACISDLQHHFRMRQIKYHDYAPVPSAWYYKAPEELADPSLVGYGADVYSWASVVYEILTGKRPYHGIRDVCGVLRVMQDGHRSLLRPSEIKPALWCLLVKCWALDPGDRPSMPDVLSELRGFK